MQFASNLNHMKITMIVLLNCAKGNFQTLFPLLLTAQHFCGKHGKALYCLFRWHLTLTQYGILQSLKRFPCCMNCCGFLLISPTNLLIYPITIWKYKLFTLEMKTVLTLVTMFPSSHQDIHLLLVHHRLQAFTRAKFQLSWLMRNHGLLLVKSPCTLLTNHKFSDQQFSLNSLGYGSC